jgi:AcrR family transcriptional regulator
MRGATTLREEHRRQTRELILNAAREVFFRAGGARLTMRDLAQRIGCSPGVIYLHFAGKQELLHCLVEDSFARLLDVLNEVPVAADPSANLKARLRAYVNFGLLYPHHYYLAFQLAPATRKRKARSTVTPHEAFEVLRRSVAECRAKGLMRGVDAETASQALWAAVHGLTSLLIAKPDFPWVGRETLIGSVIDMVVVGLMNEPAESGRGKRGRARERERRGDAVPSRRGAR